MKSSSIFSRIYISLNKGTEITLPRSFVTALLISFYALALVFTDYWNIPENTLSKLLMFTATVLAGIAWSYLGSATFRFTFKWKHLVFLVILFGLMVLLNINALRYDVAWRGDEDHHILFTMSVFRKVTTIHWLWILTAFICWTGILILAWKHTKIALFFGILFTGIILLLYPNESLFGSLRYPYLNYWLDFFAMYPGGLIFSKWHEVLYRIVPFLSAVGLAWVVQKSLLKEKDFSHLFWGIAVAIIPSVFYYSSVLYLEMPAVMLMTLACLNSEQLLTGEFRDIKHNPGWYALILIGFIKETTLPFVLCFVGARFLVRFWLTFTQPGETKQKKRPGDFLLNEIPVCFVVLFPIIYYLALRFIFSHTRPYSFTPANLIDPEIYKVLLFSIFDQFGLFIFMFLAGIVLLVIKKRIPSLLLYVVMIFGYALFYMLDQKIYVGYSRFNLFFLPLVLAGAVVFIKWIIEKRRGWSYALVVVTLIVSIIMSPINRDGSKEPGWGNYLFDTSEHYYPVEDAIKYLKAQGPEDSTLFAGMYYEYFFHFYARKLNWTPSFSDILLSDIENQDDVLNLRAAMQAGEQRGFDTILFFVLGEKIPAVPTGSPYIQDKVIQNDAHTIVIYRRMTAE